MTSLGIGSTTQANLFAKYNDPPGYQPGAAAIPPAVWGNGLGSSPDIITPNLSQIAAGWGAGVGVSRGFMNWILRELGLYLNVERDDNLAAIFGVGDEGDVTITTATGIARDTYYQNLTIDGGSADLQPGGHRIFVNGTLTLTNNGRISYDGGSAASRLGAGSGANSLAVLGGGQGGGDGGQSGSTGGDDGDDTDPGVGGAGGDGGNGDSGNGSGGTQNVDTADGGDRVFCNLESAMSGRPPDRSAKISGGAGGGGGAAGGLSNHVDGGGGGAGGGVILIAARNIIIESSSEISAQGGNGSDALLRASDNGSQQGGGGGGGGGGAIILLCRYLANDGLITTGGGGAGLGQNGGGNGSPGDDGSIYILQV